MTKTGDRNRTRRRYLCGLLLRGFASPLENRDGQSAHFPEIESKVSVLHVLVVVLYTLMLLADHLIAFVPSPLTVCHFYQNTRGEEALQMLLRRGSSVQPAPPESCKRGSG